MVVLIITGNRIEMQRNEAHTKSRDALFVVFIGLLLCGRYLFGNKHCPSLFF